MALKKTYTLKNGLVVPDAYIKLETCASTKQNATMRVGIYTNKEYAQNGETVHEFYHIFQPDYSDGANNLWRQAYKYLKTLPGFEDAEDV